MIKHVTFENTTYADLPFKFEAGTPDFIGIAAFAKAIDFIDHVGFELIGSHERELLEYTTPKLLEIPGLKIYGTAPGKEAVISFNVGDIHNYDLGLLLDRMGVAVRTGHHCAQPLMERLGVPGCVRASFAIYNTRQDADDLLSALHRVIPILS